MNIKILYTEEEGDMRKRLSYLLVVAVFVSMLSLSGCGGGVKKVNSDDDSVSVTISYWPNSETDAERHALYDTYLDQMKKLYPNITIIPDEEGYGIDNFMVLAATNQLPNVYRKPFTEPQQIINAGYALDITKAVKEYGYDKGINPDIMKISMKDGKYYGVPYSGYMIGMAYNVNVFKKAGLVNSDGSLKLPTTYDELVETAKIIKEKTGIPGYAIQTANKEGGWAFMNIAWSYGVKFMEQKPDGKWVSTFDTPEAVAALEYIKDLKWKHGVFASNVLIDSNELQKLLATDRIGMCILAESAPASIVTKYKTDKDAIAYGPVMKGPSAQVSQVGGDIYMFSNNTDEKQVDAAFKWFEFLGITPNVGKDYETKLEETLKADIAADKLVVPKSLKLWVNKERTSIDDALYKKYSNANPLYWTNAYPDTVKIQQEEPVCAQNLYALLSTAMQNVLTDPNADCAKIIHDASETFQKDYLDKQ